MKGGREEGRAKKKGEKQPQREPKSCKACTDSDTRESAPEKRELGRGREGGNRSHETPAREIYISRRQKKKSKRSETKKRDQHRERAISLETTRRDRQTHAPTCPHKRAVEGGLCLSPRFLCAVPV